MNFLLHRIRGAQSKHVLTMFSTLLLIFTVGVVSAFSHTLVVGTSSDLSSLDPCFGSAYAYMLYETPVGFQTEQQDNYAVQVVDDAQGWKPLLAEEIEIGSDGRTYIFHLRQDVRFYPSGNKMTAADWLYSSQRQLSNPAIGYCEFENHEASITDLDSIEIIDDYTIRITTDEVNPRTLPFMRFQQFAILDSEEVQRHATADDPWSTEWLSQNTAGTGPYYIASHIPGNEIVLEANPYHWDEEPYFTRIVLKVIPDVTTRLALLQRGDLDIALDIPGDLAERAASRPHIQLVAVPSSNRIYAGFNPQIEPFGNLAFRQAIAYAIPYDDIIEYLFGGRARRYDSFVLPDVPGYSGEGFDYDLDLDKARAKLAESGVAPGTTIPLSIDSAVPLHQEIALLIQDYLGRIGLKVELNVMPSAQFKAQRHDENLGFYIHSTISWIDDPSTIVGLWMVSDAPGNRTQFASDIVDELQERWQFAPYSEERNAAYEQIQAIYNKQLPVIYLALPHHTVLMTDDIDGYALYKDSYIRYHELYRKEQ